MTSKAAAKTTNTSSGDPLTTLGFIGTDLLNVTWRIAVPVIGFVLIGIFADRRMHTAPWFTLLALVLGFGIAGWLVKRQLTAIERKEKKQ